jgi:Tfp pilus assembly protein PilF
MEDFTQAIKLKPDNPTSYHLRGHSKQDLGQEEAAQIDFEKAKELETAQ